MSGGEQLVSEAKIERECCEWAGTRGWFQVKITSPSRNGMPDRVFIRHAVHVWVEFKDEGEVATKQQLRCHEAMRAHGAEVHVCDNINDFKTILGAYGWR